eukprot:TRINITY_DN13665_c1_g2_i1.p1 TRINITY_DN13665_c1_g2~~TRINITY_DN13665_c1_g2_i1.p1  ORF type:complete len:388 (+),score=90.16 TRINITY_DN13665_c1_g2_i1:106-1164(+)
MEFAPIEDIILGDVQPNSSCAWDVMKLDVANDIIMGLLGVGTFASFIPMWFSIGLNRSSQGVSVTAILLLNITNWLSTLGVGLQNWQRFLCCPQWDAMPCCRSLLPTLVVAANVGGCIPILLLCVIFFDPCADDAKPLVHSSSRKTNLSGHSSRVSTAVSLITAPQQIVTGNPDYVQTKCQAALTFVFHMFLMAATCFIAGLLLHQYGVDSNAVSSYADACNIAAGVTQAVSWLPQIWHTYRSKDVGNLSLVTVLIQGPGAAAVGISLLTAGQQFTSVIQYVVTFILMVVLLVECLYYIAAKRPKGTPLCPYVCQRGFLRECRDYPDDASDEECYSESDAPPRGSDVTPPVA